MIDWGHIVFDAILSIVAQKLRIGLYFYMGEACSDVSKKSILSHRHTNLRVSPLHAHMANSNHKRLSIDAYVFFSYSYPNEKVYHFYLPCTWVKFGAFRIDHGGICKFWLPNTYLL